MGCVMLRAPRTYGLAGREATGERSKTRWAVRAGATDSSEPLVRYSCEPCEPLD